MLTILMTAMLSSASPAPQPAAAEQRICKSAAQAGSRIKQKKVCRTAAEWKELDADRQQLSRDLKSSSQGTGE